MTLLRMISLAIFVVALMIFSGPAQAAPQNVAFGTGEIPSTVSDSLTGLTTDASLFCEVDLSSLRGKRGGRGEQGDRGPQGYTGPDGKGVERAWIDGGTGHLWFEFSTGEWQDLGIVMGPPGPSIVDSFVTIDGDLIFIRDDGRRLEAGNLQRMIDRLIPEENPKTSLPPWFWWAVIMGLLVVLAVLVGRARAQSDEVSSQHEKERIENGKILIMTAAVKGFSCSFKEQGGSGSQEFTIGKEEVTPEGALEEQWKKEVIGGFVGELDRKFQEVLEDLKPREDKREFRDKDKPESKREPEETQGKEPPKDDKGKAVDKKRPSKKAASKKTTRKSKS